MKSKFESIVQSIVASRVHSPGLYLPVKIKEYDKEYDNKIIVSCFGNQTVLPLMNLLSYPLQQQGLFRMKVSKRPLKIGTAERKVLIIFCYYVLLSVIALMHSLHWFCQDFYKHCSWNSRTLAMWAFWCWFWECMRWKESIVWGTWIHSIILYFLYCLGVSSCSQPHICS